MDRVEFRCSLLEKLAPPLSHAWEHTVGSGHAPLALRADWRDQLRRCHHELGFRYVRFHGLLCDDMSTVVSHKNGLLYSFFNADSIVDFLLSIGMRPFVELSFMPGALSSGHKTVFHYRANVTPPRDYRQWAALIHGLVRHWVDRYGIEEVRLWFFEVWNEPNLKAFWTGTQKDYFRLYQDTAKAIKTIDAKLKVGGPATAQNAWIAEFLAFCEKGKIPADFVSTHHYPTDALGNEEQDTETQLANSQRSLLRQWIQDTRRRARGKPVHYTEWNTSSNERDPLHDSPYAAAFIVKSVMEASDLVESYSFWTFSDIFEESYFPSVPFHGGFGLLTVYGIPKPAYRAYELLHRLGADRLILDGLHHTVDAWVVLRERTATFLVANHALPRHPIQTERIHLRMTDAPELSQAYVERIDEDHANPRRVWREIGSPVYPSPAEIRRLQDASMITKERQRWKYGDQTVDLEISVPPHGVAAVTLEFA